MFNVVTCRNTIKRLFWVEMSRSYGQDDCPIARTLDLVGERCTILVLRELFLKGPRRFQDLQDALAGVAPNTLSARLKDLETAGFIGRESYSQHPPRLEYHLTDKGKSFGPVMRELRKWGLHHT